MFKGNLQRKTIFKYIVLLIQILHTYFYKTNYLKKIKLYKIKLIPIKKTVTI